MTYDFRINTERAAPFNPEHDLVDVVVTLDAKEYLAYFATRSFIDHLFEKNQRTGEFAQGKYFSMPNLMLVDRITPSVVRATIDDLLEKGVLELYFKHVNERTSS